MNRLFIKEDSRRYMPARKKFKTAVCGISQGAGATTIAVTLAFLMSKNLELCQNKNEHKLVTYVEMERPFEGRENLYTAMGFDRKFGGKIYYDWFGHMEKGDAVAHRLNMYKRVNWIIHEKPAGTVRLNEPESIIKAVPGALVIADNPDTDFLQDYDVIVGVINPLPGSIFAGMKTLKKIKNLEKSGHNVIWAVNGVNDRIPLKKLENFLKINEYIRLPLIDGRIFYECEYLGLFWPEELMRKEDPLPLEYVKNMEILCEKVLKLYETN